MHTIDAILLHHANLSVPIGLPTLKSKRQIFLYSAVDDHALFQRVGFYRDDLQALAASGDTVVATNSLMALVRHRPQVIVGYFYTKAVFAAFIGRLLGARVILTGGADQVSPVLAGGFKLFVHQSIAFFCLLFAHRVLLSCAEDMQNFHTLSCGLPWLVRKLRLAPHVVRPSRERATHRVPKRGEFHAFSICWMGSPKNVMRKGLDRAVKLIALLRGIGVDATLAIAGTDGPGRNYLEALSREYSVVPFIEFLGPISEDEKNRRFSIGSVYLQLSSHEGFGVAAAEAFFSGMLVVHSNKGGLADVIGEKGFVLDFDDLSRNETGAVESFYSSFLEYRIDRAFIETEIERYSVATRHKFFLEQG